MTRMTWFVVVLLLCLSLGANAALAEGKKYALVVGVETYDPEFFHRLAFAEDDAEEIGDALTKLGFDVTVMTRQADIPSRRPNTAKKIVDQLTRRLAGLQQEDTVIVTFSGHGVQYKQPKSKVWKDEAGNEHDEAHFFCPEEADLKDPRSMVPLGQVYALVERCSAERKLLIVDACRNEVLSQEGKSVPEIELEPAGVTPRTVPKGMLALFSCSEKDKSFEDPEHKHGVFSYYALKYLRGEADPRHYFRDQISVQGLATYASIETRDRVFRRLNKDQLPELKAPNGFSDWPIGKAEVRLLKNSIGMEFALIPAGEFQMGSTAADVNRLAREFSDFKTEYANDEQPPHQVKISQPFYLGKYEVTKGEFAKFVAAENYRTEAERDGKGGWGYNVSEKRFEGRKPQYTWRNTGWTPYDDSHPVVNVTWNDAKAFCAWLSRKEGVTYRLPTEAEWEYACRAGTATRHPGGDDTASLARIANIADQSTKRIAGYPDSIPVASFDDGHKFTAPVGSFAANKFGLHDMIGNVWEWCADVYDEKAYGKRSPLTTDPLVTSGSENRVLRGGSWYYLPRGTRSAYRLRNSPDNRNFYFGFRVVR